MKAAVLRKIGSPLEISEVDKPKMEKGKIIVKIVACGVCHTDLHAVSGDWPVKPQLPFIPGHEGVGYVDEIGEGVTNVKIGDRVGVPWLYTACGSCKYCKSGWETLCDNQKNTGYSVNGSFAEYVLADPKFVGKIPKNLDFAEAVPILCAGVTVYKGLKETEVRPGESVVVSGIGGLGPLAVQYAVAMGMNVIAVDIDDKKLTLAKSLGATITINAKTDDPIEKLSHLGGAEGVLVTAVSTSSFSQGFGMLAKKGIMSLVGWPPGDFPLPIFDTVLTRKTIRGLIVGTRLDLEESLKFASEGKVSTHYSLDKLENINKIFDRMKNGQIEEKVVIEI
ncbi:zinc-dependent alcohol dehydrogenase [Arenibacter sp. TNZ]|uniref:zinc-dependent alcohol dehydrogenase n=1 Tax=Arenibacter TaxID=178469 RepID=UPI000CD44315|nr:MULTISPECIES: zinc-dependent alcohol dehydrogenase [Arenibacter]MCM4171913.1 zinc-dependent alcohol dehydrogenase [Arenibacter sp. TNZ]